MENYFKDRWFFCLKWFSSKYNKMFHNYGNIWPLVLIFEVFTLRYLRFKLNDSPRTFCETDFFRFSKWHWAHFLWNGWETLLNVEFFTSCYGKRPVNSEVNSSSTSGREESQAKRRRSENECSIIPAQLKELSAPSNDTLLTTAFASSNENSGASVQAVTGASATLGDKGDETVLESSQQCYAISLRE